MNAARNLPIFTSEHPQTIEGLKELHERNFRESNDYQGPLSERDMIQNILRLAEDINVNVSDLLEWDAQEIRDVWEIMLSHPMTTETVMEILNRTTRRVQKFVLMNKVKKLDE